MFRVTRAEEQALRLAMRLASRTGRTTLAELAAAEDLPEPTVAKLLGLLRRGGVAVAERGRNGGYLLADRPEAISAARVLAAVTGDPAFGYACRDTTAPAPCNRSGDCGLRSVWRHLERRVAGVLRETSLADLLRDEASVDRAVQDLWPAADDGVPPRH